MKTGVYVTRAGLTPIYSSAALAGDSLLGLRVWLKQRPHWYVAHKTKQKDIAGTTANTVARCVHGGCRGYAHSPTMWMCGFFLQSCFTNTTWYCSYISCMCLNNLHKTVSPRSEEALQRHGAVTSGVLVFFLFSFSYWANTDRGLLKEWRVMVTCHVCFVPLQCWCGSYRHVYRAGPADAAHPGARVRRYTGHGIRDALASTLDGANRGKHARFLHLALISCTE